MLLHSDITNTVFKKLYRQNLIAFAGNKKLKIFGSLHCSSGKRMKKENLYFFISEKEAIENGFRPCGHCMKAAYKKYTMSLFPVDPTENILPADGTVLYYGKLFDAEKATFYLDKLLTGIEWKNDEAVIFGKHIITKRKVAWYADKNFSYTYSNTTKTALPWTKELLEIKKLVEETTGTVYNSCLLNLYHTGDEGMAWHSDDEKALGKNTSIGSVSFGAERKFAFKHKKTGEVISLMLEHGSLLEMKGATQSNWMHRLPKTTKVSSPRVNLTFRTMVEM